jgi:hypothetical protein
LFGLMTSVAYPARQARSSAGLAARQGPQVDRQVEGALDDLAGDEVEAGGDLVLIATQRRGIGDLPLRPLRPQGDGNMPRAQRGQVG